MNTKMIRRDVPVKTTRITVRVPTALSGVTELRVAQHPAMQLLKAFAKAAERR